MEKVSEGSEIRFGDELRTIDPQPMADIRCRSRPSKSATRKFIKEIHRQRVEEVASQLQYEGEQSSGL